MSSKAKTKTVRRKLVSTAVNSTDAGLVPSNYQLIYATVRSIPKGRVATYGQVAELAGLPRQARLVGYALNVLPAGSTVPWHRVVNAQGRISLRSAGEGHDQRQRRRLEREGVHFNLQGHIDLGKFRWRPKGSL